MATRAYRPSLRSQLLTVMLLMLFLSLGSFAYLQTVMENRILDVIQDEINGLTKAVEISVEQITAAGSTNKARFNNYLDQLQRRGLQEVSILSAQQEVINSSNPRMIGSKLSVGRNELLITQKIGEKGNGSYKKMYDAFVPVITQGHLEGYIHVRMYFDDIDNLSRDMLYQKALWAMAIFGVGVILCIFIAYRYAKPIPVLIAAIHSVAQGRMPRLPVIPQTDIRSLADSIQEMIQKLEERKTMEEKLKHAERQAMLAQLASGVAHEIRNPLNFISLCVDHLKALNSIANTGDASTTGALLDKTKHEIRRVNQMVSNFLDLGRELVLCPVRSRADFALEEILGLSEPLLSDRGIQVKKTYCTPMPEIDIDIDRMKSCFQNLIQNAADAMPGGGMLNILIETRDKVVGIIFRDTGVGIRPNDLALVYEPYFTTKKTGTGLGLAICKRIVDAHHGSIRMQSETGRGTTVTLSFPVAVEGE